MQEEFPDYQKYKWFFTSSGKLVVGGKSSIQNDELLKKLKRSSEHDHIVMHTSSPGSPFSIIIAPIKEVSPKDIEEAAIFTGCFSHAWREKKKQAQIDIFNLSHLYKSILMKSGTWGVKGKVEKKVVEISLVLTKQENKLRAVPEKTVKKKKDILLKVRPGKIDKRAMLPKFQVLLPGEFSQEDILSALPAGGVSIIKS